MGLLLKSLKQIDWRPAEAPAEEELAQCAELTAAIEDLPEERQPSIAELNVAEAPSQLAEPETVEPETLEPPAAEQQAIELRKATEPEIQTAESTLDKLNELHQLIDAALEEFSSTQPYVVQPPEADPRIAPPAIALEQLEQQDSAIEFSPVDAATDTVVPLPSAIIPIRVFPSTAATSAQSNSVPNIRIRDEYRELRDHLLARFRLDEPSTLLAIDAGRVTNDASWLAPFSACLWEMLSDKPTLRLSAPPRILLVEAAGPECGIARHLGLDCPLGLVDVLQGKSDWADAIQPTYHPQIDLLSRGNASLLIKQSGQIANVWDDLEQRYQAIMVAAGPWEAPSQASWRKTGMATAAILLPLADAAVLCVELEGTPQEVAVETKQAMERRGIRILGCVVSGQ